MAFTVINISLFALEKQDLSDGGTVNVTPFVRHALGLRRRRGDRKKRQRSKNEWKEKKWWPPFQIEKFRSDGWTTTDGRKGRPHRAARSNTLMLLTFC